MPDYGLSPTGFIPKRLDEILADINSSTRQIFGQNINLTPESPDGQLNGTISESFSYLWQLAFSVYSAFDPEAAAGQSLSRLVLLNGISRNPATFSTAVLTFTGTAGTVIPLGFQVAVENTDGEDVFATDEIVTIAMGGTISVAATATIAGAIQGTAGTITQIVSLIGGIASVTNAQDAVLGANEETDIALRIRRRNSTEFPSSNLLDSLFSKLLDILTVTSVRVYENDTSMTDINGLPPHSFNAIILGGDNLTIAETIWTTKPPGILTFSSFGNFTNITDSQGIIRPIYYDRPVQVPIYIIVNTNTFEDFPADGVSQIQNNIVSYATNPIYFTYNYGIGQEVLRTRLFAPINAVPGHSVQTLFIGLAPNPTGVIDIPIAFNALATFSVANITVNTTPV